MVLKKYLIRTGGNGAGIRIKEVPAGEAAGKGKEGSCKKRSGEALLTCFLKDNTDGKPDARRKAVIICPGGGYEFCSTREGGAGGISVSGDGLPGFETSLTYVAQHFPGSPL